MTQAQLDSSKTVTWNQPRLALLKCLGSIGALHGVGRYGVGWPCSSLLIFCLFTSRSVQWWGGCVAHWTQHRDGLQVAARSLSHTGNYRVRFSVLCKSTEDPKSQQIVCKVLRSCNQCDEGQTGYESRKILILYSCLNWKQTSNTKQCCGPGQICSISGVCSVTLCPLKAGYASFWILSCFLNLNWICT